MKSFLLKASLFSFLTTSVFAGVNLYKDYNAGDSIKPGAIKAQKNEISYLPIQETKDMKYYKGNEGEYLLYKNGKLIAVNEVTNELKSLKMVNSEIEVNLQNSKFLGAKIILIDRKTNKVKDFKAKTQKELFKIVKDLKRENKNINKMITISEGFIENNKSKRTILIRIITFKEENKDCINCKFVDQETPGKITEEIYTIKLYTI